jgi:hypothetical protein
VLWCSFFLCHSFRIYPHQISIHPKTFSVTSPAQRGNVARNHLARLMSRMKLLPPNPEAMASTLPKRLQSPDAAFAWDPVLSPAKNRVETEVTESYKLDRSMWMWMEQVAHDGGMWAAHRIFSCDWMEPNDDRFVTAEPVIPKSFQFNVHGLLSAIEANQKACQVTLHDEMEVDRHITSVLRSMRWGSDDKMKNDDGSEDGSESDEDSEGEKHDVLESELHGCERSKRLNESASLAASCVQLQPVDRPGSEGWETLTPYGIQHPLRDYQKKVQVCGCEEVSALPLPTRFLCRRSSGCCRRSTNGGELREIVGSPSQLPAATFATSLRLVGPALCDWRYLFTL